MPRMCLRWGNQKLLRWQVVFVILLISLDPVGASEDGIGKEVPNGPSSGKGHKRIVIAIAILVVVAICIGAGLGYLVYRCLVPGARTLDPSVVESFPMLMYPTPNDVGFGATECSICLEEFTDGAWVRVLPSCHHIYHPLCIQKWMTTRKALCPDCRHDYYRRGVLAD
ncbi:hypothetical protein RHGRI_011882 [Rhododendron griersonianum]|uniref:RING-type E3 ubiquitin transferase n=1 Tax=Rhododendron griersonianum TaxID=479676 RepID=A0AAV6KPV5_9ERIC|nr:hypothetical protein RHGRI_011882 [Rhododendron griersonianum]